MAVFPLKSGDLDPPIEATLRDANGDPINLTGIGEVRFRMARGRDSVIDQAAEVVGDPTEGNVRYTWQPGDTDIAAIYRCEFPVISADRPTTFPNADYDIVRIHRSLAAVTP